jgi:hypothetical protein
MRAAGVKDYETFAHEVLAVVTDKPISFEVFAVHFPEMKRQGAQNRRMSEQCLRKDHDHQYEERAFTRLDPTAVVFRGESECDRYPDPGAGPGSGGVAGVAMGEFARVAYHLSGE